LIGAARQQAVFRYVGELPKRCTKLAPRHHSEGANHQRMAD